MCSLKAYYRPLLLGAPNREVEGTAEKVAELGPCLRMNPRPPNVNLAHSESGRSS